MDLSVQYLQCWPLKKGELVQSYMGVSKNRGKTPKMDGENNGKPY